MIDVIIEKKNRDTSAIHDRYQVCGYYYDNIIIVYPQETIKLT